MPGGPARGAAADEDGPPTVVEDYPPRVMWTRPGRVEAGVTREEWVLMLTRRYEIFIRGVVPASLLDEMSGSHPGVEAQTVLRGQVRDQAELQGLLLRLHSLGLELVEMRQVPVEPTADLPSARGGG